MTNEIKRRIQMLRKDATLVESDQIKVFVNTEKEVESILKRHEKDLSGEVNAVSIEYGPADGTKEYKIDGRLVKIAIKKN